MAPDSDERPFGWGVCAVCGEDCEEQDYDPLIRRSAHPECRQGLARAIREHRDQEFDVAPDYAAMQDDARSLK